MRNRKNSEKTPEGNEAFNPDEDRYPSFKKVLHAISNAEDIPKGPIDRLEVHCMANGDAAWRVWPARAEEPAIGFLNAGTLE